jgi:Arc/MetJ family transcription regulator
MRITIDIDDGLIAKAMRAAGTSTKKEVVREALELLVRVRENEYKIRQRRGKVRWEGDLDEMRRGDAPLEWGEDSKDGMSPNALTICHGCFRFTQTPFHPRSAETG